MVPWWTNPNPVFKLTPLFDAKYLTNATNTAIVTIEGEYETAPKLSNGTNFNDLEGPLTTISRSRYYSTSNNSQTVQDRAIITMTDYHHHILFAKKRRRATRKAEAHHTLVAHYIAIVNMRIKHTTHISTYKHSKQVYHRTSTHYTLTRTHTHTHTHKTIIWNVGLGLRCWLQYYLQFTITKS